MDRDSLSTNVGDSSSHSAAIVTPVEKKKVVTGAQGTYELEEQPFSRSDYTQVFKARNTTTDVTCACKVISLRRPSLTDEERDNIDREIAILSLMQHENIIAFVDQYRAPDQIYIFTELVQGTTLVEYYRNNNNYMTERDARLIFQQVLCAVKYMHKHGIIHRDIKSENILIDDHLHVKLVDFGLARRANGPHVLTGICGTLSYMAPEIMKGGGHNFSVDIWSLGVLLFRMLVGEYPFDDELYGKSVRKETEEDPETGEDPETEEDPKTDQGVVPDYITRDWRPFVDKQSKRSPEVKHLLEAMLEVDPSRRSRVDQILSSDWMRMIDQILADFDKIELSGSNQILESNEGSTSSDAPAQAHKEPWGVLTILPGGFRDAPRRIELKDSSYVLGRVLEDNVDILLGSNRAISVKHCIIKRDDKGVVMMANTSLNGTYINNWHFGKMRSGQLFNGDVLGIVVCTGHLSDSTDTILGCSYCLKYKVTLFGAEKATPEQLACRIYTDHSHKGYKKRRPRDRTPDEYSPIWGKLVGQKGLTETVRLQGERTIIGRDRACDIVLRNDYVSRRHCVIEWEDTEKKAYLTSLSRNGTVVNNEPFEGRIQLRNTDVIRIINTIEEPGRERIRLSYRLIIQDKETIPAMKRVKNAPVNIPEPILQFGPEAAASPIVGESSGDEQDEDHKQSHQQHEEDDQETLYGHSHQQEDEERDED